MRAVYIENNAYNILVLEDLRVHYDLTEEDLKELLKNKDVRDWSFVPRERVYEKDTTFEKVIEQALERKDKIIELEVEAYEY